MNILITNADLDLYAGTQVVVRDLALELRRRGHRPIAYSRVLGDVAQEMRANGIEVTDDLSRLSVAPDIVHGQHHPLAIEALLRFPSAPGILVCHAARGYAEMPVYFPRILRYVGIDERCRKRIASVAAIPRERIGVIFNAVDLDRFRPRQALPPVPKRAAVFSNNANLFTHLPAVRRACLEMGIVLEVLGRTRGKPVPDPQAFLPRYDLVFAKARCALEAMAVGCAVVLCDVAGAGPMVTTHNYDALRPMNFGIGMMTAPVDSKHLRAEAERYDPYDAAAVSRRVRGEAGLVAAGQKWLDLYAEVLAEWARTTPDRGDEARVAAAYVEQWGGAKRIEWAKRQLRRVKSVPVIGLHLHHLGHRLARAVTQDREL